MWSTSALYLHIALSIFLSGMISFILIVGGLPGDNSALFHERKNFLDRWLSRLAGIYFIVCTDWYYFYSDTTSGLLPFTTWAVPIGFLFSAWLTYNLYADSLERINGVEH